MTEYERRPLTPEELEALNVLERAGRQWLKTNSDDNTPDQHEGYGEKK